VYAQKAAEPSLSERSPPCPPQGGKRRLHKRPQKAAKETTEHPISMAIYHAFGRDDGVLKNALLKTQNLYATNKYICINFMQK
jgi:hypothetical protein